MNPLVKQYKRRRQNNRRKRNKDKTKRERNDLPDKTNLPPVILGYHAEMEETSRPETTADDEDDYVTDEEEDVAEEESDFGEAEQSSDGESSTETDDASFKSLHEKIDNLPQINPIVCIF
jgi:hypothetical protein